MREDFLERMDMADQDEDETDLKQLKQLRQIWLAMPDEEPPTRGLDALMVAARQQAATVLQEPVLSWWRKLLGAMVRPPVLAMATLVVVVGGAALVSRHHDELESSPVVASEVGSSAVVTVTRHGDTKQEREVAGSGALAQTEETAKPEVVPQIVHDAVPRPDQRLPAAKPTSAKKPASKPDHDEISGSKVVLANQPRLDVATPDRTTKSDDSAGNNARKGEGQTPSTEMSPGEDNSEAVRAEPKPRPTPPKDAKVSKGPAPIVSVPAGVGGSTATAPGSSGPAQIATDSPPDSVQALMQKARAAAQRGDCPAVKSIASTIARQDVSFYRSTTLKDPAVAKCL